MWYPSGVHWVIVSILLAACGRVGFEPLDGRSGGGDGSSSDGGGDDGGDGGTDGGTVPCSLGAPTCPRAGGLILGVGSSLMEGNSIASYGSGMQGSCGGANADEYTLEVTAQQAGTLHVTTADSSFDTVLYVRTSCTGAELACNDDAGGGLKTSELSLAVAAGQTVVVVVDGQNQCGRYLLLLELLDPS